MYKEPENSLKKKKKRTATIDVVTIAQTHCWANYSPLGTYHKEITLEEEGDGKVD